MKLKVFTVFDSKLEAYLQPFFMQTKGAAIRAFSDTVSRGDHEFARHPADYTLFEIGEYDDSTGVIENYKAHLSLGTALEHKSNEQTKTVDL